MTVKKSPLQTGVDYAKHYAKATWQRYKSLGIWGKVSLVNSLTFDSWVVLPPSD